MTSFIKSVTFDCHEPARWGGGGDLFVMLDPEGNEFCLEN